MSKYLYEEYVRKFEDGDKNFVYIQKLSEGLKLSDLMQSSGMSNFTKKFRKERNSLNGSENRTAKLIGCKINKTKDWVTFIFKTIPTSNEPLSKKKKTKPKQGFSLTKAKSYQLQIRILDFFKLLDTTPEDITNKDIEDVLEVADIQVWSNDPSQIWQGHNYHLSIMGGAIYPTDIAPTNKTNKNGNVIGWKDRHNSDNFVSKHLGGLLNQIKFFIPQMRMKIKKELGLTKK